MAVRVHCRTSRIRARNAAGTDGLINGQPRVRSETPSAGLEQVLQGRQSDSLLTAGCHADLAELVVCRNEGSHVLQGDEPTMLREIIVGGLDLLVSDRVRGFHVHRDLGAGAPGHPRLQVDREGPPIGLQSRCVNRRTQSLHCQGDECAGITDTRERRNPGQTLRYQDQVGRRGVKRVPGRSEDRVSEPGIRVQKRRRHDQPDDQACGSGPIGVSPEPTATLQEPAANQYEQPQQNDEIATDKPDRSADQELQGQPAREAEQGPGWRSLGVPRPARCRGSARIPVPGGS